jgi:hypothetical protein
VGTEGLEPSTNGVSCRYSTTELCALGASVRKVLHLSVFHEPLGSMVESLRLGGMESPRAS